MTALDGEAKVAVSSLAQTVFDNAEARLAADAKPLEQVRAALPPRRTKPQVNQ